MDREPVKPFGSREVAAVFDSYPKMMRSRLLVLRELIFETAEATEGVGELEETLKWGEPAYLTRKTRSGSTVRLAWKSSSPNRYAIHFNCQTKLVESFRLWYPRELTFDGNRSILFDEDEEVPTDVLRECIATALTYHRRKRAKSG